MNFKRLFWGACIGGSLLLVSCTGSATEITLTDDELSIIEGIVKAPSSVVSGDTGSSNNIVGVINCRSSINGGSCMFI